MALRAPQTDHPADRGALLGRAALRASAYLGLSARELAPVLGLSEPSVSRLKSGSYHLDEDTKPYELAALFVRLFRSLDAIAGGDRDVARAWMRAPNEALAGVPVTQIASISGLVETVAYLDARRAPL